MPIPLSTALAVALLSPPAAPPVAPQDDPPARALSLELTAAPRLAGTPGSLRAVEMVQRVLQQAGWTVEIDERVVLLSLPRRLELEFFEDQGREESFRLRLDRFDPDAIPAGDLPLFNAWSAEGEVRGEVVDAGHGTRADFETLLAARIDLAGKVALCRYGGGYRGIKVELAQEYGCAGVLLFSDPDDDGAAKGPTWPAGPWKPAGEAQRGAVGPMARGPGDVTTPGFASPPPGADLPAGRLRLGGETLAARLPAILVLPIGAADAALLLERLSMRRVRNADGTRVSLRLGPGPVSVRMAVDAPRELRTIRNVIGRLPGTRSGVVMAGNHRDAWVRGAHDAGSGTVSLLRAAQHLGQRVDAGWRPQSGITLAFWDGEESGLIGSTEWGEAHATELREHCLVYVNGDAVVSGLQFRASGTPGLEGVLARSLARVRLPHEPERTLLEPWLEAAGDHPPRLGLPGSGSDFTVFLHHLCLPVLDIGFHGNAGGQYHTAFDDFLMMERFLDPGWVGHETAGLLLAELLGELSALGPLAFDDAGAATEMARHARAAADWLGEQRAERLAAAFDALAQSVSGYWRAWRAASDFVGDDASDSWTLFLQAASRAENAAALSSLHTTHLPPRFYQGLADDRGLAGREWFQNPLWAPGLEAGYGSETFPGLRRSAEDTGASANTDPHAAPVEAVQAAAPVEVAVTELVERIDALQAAWRTATAALSISDGEGE